MNISAGDRHGSQGSQWTIFVWLTNFGLIILGSVCAPSIKIPTFSGVFMHGIQKVSNISGSVSEASI
jgi:hypothetical protein